MLTRAALVFLALLGACVPPHILKTGVLARPAYMSASDLAVGVEFVETGPDEAEFLKEFDLIYKGTGLHFGANGIHDRTPTASSAKDDD